MGATPPSPEAMETFGKIRLAGIVVLLLAFIPWIAQDFVSSMAATEFTAETRLRTIAERDDARVTRAFREARPQLRVKASLATETNLQQQTRDSLLTVTAKSKSEALADLDHLTEAIRTNFARQGPGELYMLDRYPHAGPVANGTMILLRQICRWVALVLLVGGLAMIFNAWRHSGLPKAALLGVLATIATFAIMLMGRDTEGAVWGTLIVAGMPILFLALVTHLTLKVRKARSWIEGRASILTSHVEVERHRFVGDTTKVTNKAAVTYEFSAGSKTFQGDQISLGAGPADQVNETLTRYAVGKEVPVYYDPANPKDCVLERDPPASLGCIWTGTIAAVLVYGAVVATFWYGYSINAVFESAFPAIHHPVIVIGPGFLGLFCLGSFFWNRRHPVEAVPWLVTKGAIVGSDTETYLSTAGSSGGSHTRYYKAVIEYSYNVEGQEYHNTIGESGGSRSSAEAEVARYPVGMELEVYYDPRNPTRSALEKAPATMAPGLASLIVAVVLLAVAVYAALH